MKLLTDNQPWRNGGYCWICKRLMRDCKGHREIAMAYPPRVEKVTEPPKRVSPAITSEEFEQLDRTQYKKLDCKGHHWDRPAIKEGPYSCPHQAYENGPTCGHKCTPHEGVCYCPYHGPFMPPTLDRSGNQ